MNLAHVIILLSPIDVPLIISALLFFQFEKRNFSKQFLGIFMLNTTLVFIGNFYYFTRDFSSYAVLHPLHIFVVLMIYPGIYTYIASLLNSDFKIKQHIVHYVPAFIYLLVTSFIFFLLLNPEERYYFLSEYRHFPDFSKPVLKTLFIIRISNMALLFGQIFFYGYSIMKLMRMHRDKIEHSFLSPDKFRMSWIRSFNILFFFTAISSIGFYAIDPEKVFGNELVLAIPLFCFSLAIWFLGIIGINQKPFYSTTTVQQSALKPEFESNNEDGLFDDNDLLFRQITRHFESQKPYLNSELKIVDLCRHIGSNRTYISNAINEYSGLNFSSYVNHYRVEEAKRIMNENPRLSLAEVSELAGFGSVSSFSRAFKSNTGVSPKEFK